MNDLITAAKALIDRLDKHGLIITEESNQLRAAVERAENPPANYSEWTARHSGRTVSPYELWTAAQQADRARIKQIITYQFGELVSDLSEVMEMIDDD